MRNSFIFILSAFLMTACSSEEQEKKGASLYFDYKIRGEEGQDMVTVLIHFRETPTGWPLALPPTGFVLLDRDTLRADSSKHGGTFYEIQKPVHEFSGIHRVSVNTGGDKIYTDSFAFAPLVLKQEPSSIRADEDLQLYLDGVTESEAVLVVLTDVDFETNDINQLDTVRNGKIVIPKADFKNLVPGPVYLQLYKLEKKRLGGSGKGGRILIEYGLKRESELTN